jgi:hypothetical protein
VAYCKSESSYTCCAVTADDKPKNAKTKDGES